MQTWHADIAKIAVMPETPDDVSVLCCAAQTADRLLSIPHIAISMGPLGTKTRTECERFGSCLTFASAGSASAPGQISVDAVRAALIQTHEEQKG